MAKKALLMILDGWGVGNKGKGDVIFNTPTPYMDSLWKDYPCSQLLASGENVGLPDGQMGNSEVGHLNIGAGRIVYQDLVKINRACADGSILKNKEIVSAYEYAVKNGKSVHLMGLTSDGGVHSSLDHLFKLVEIGKEYGVYMCHENEKDVFGDTAERVLKIMQNVDGLKYVYDPANYLQCGQSADETLATFHAKTDYFHIKEVIASTGELVPAGYGDGKIKELVAKIDSEKVLTLEPHLMEFDAYKSIDNTEMKHKFTFANEQEAFDAAVVALKNILKELNYKEEKGELVK